MTTAILNKIIFITLFFSLTTLLADSRPKVGLVLSGGGARGIAHIPVLKLIDSLQIPIDYIAGTSIGGLGGALYAMGYSGEEIEKMVLSQDWDDLFDDRPGREELPYIEKQQISQYQLDFGVEEKVGLRLPMGLIEGQKVTLLFSRWTLPFSRQRDFNNLKIPFRCVAVDLVSGKEVVLKRGALAKAMRSTISIPSIFSPVEWGDSLLIDGGIVNNLPVDVVREMGAEIVIAVNVGTPLKKKQALRSVVDIFEQAFNIPGFYREEQNVAASDILITPDLQDFSSADFDTKKLLKIEQAGKVAADKALPELLELKTFLGDSGYIPKEENSFINIDSYKPRIHSLQIVGNTRLPFMFLYQLLDVRPGQKLNIEAINQNILKLYSLNYFKSISYELEEVKDGFVKVIFFVKEKPFRRFKFGIRYDDYHRFLVAIGFQATNILLSGLRGDFQIQFPGINRIAYKASYPSMTLDRALYPFLQFELLNKERNQYDDNGSKIGEYEENIFKGGIGLGLLPVNNLNLEIEFAYEINKSTSVIATSNAKLDAKLYEVTGSLDFDYLDDVLLPKRGFRYRGIAQVSMYKPKNEFDFFKIQVWFDYYKTFFKRNTIHLRIYYGYSEGDLPFYKIISVGGPDWFIGSHYDQFMLEQGRIIGLDYRMKLNKSLYLNFYSNVLFNKGNLFKDISGEQNFLKGFGVGVQYLTFAGPVQLIYARGENTFFNAEYQNVVYLTAGYVF